MHAELAAAGLSRLPDDYCFYVNDDATILLLLWVDDCFMFVADSAQQAADAIWLRLKKRFVLHDIVEVKHRRDCLGCLVSHDLEGRRISSPPQAG